jgi:hypothetical protein
MNKLFTATADGHAETYERVMTDKQIYQAQRYMALRRGIAFNLTYDEWLCWWQDQLGPAWRKYRGRRAHDYVMGRIGDQGPYELGNIICITAAQNSEQRRKFPKQRLRLDETGKRVYTKLDANKAKKIYQAKGTQNEIARQFGCSARLVRMIKAKQILGNEQMTREAVKLPPPFT